MKNSKPLLGQKRKLRVPHDVFISLTAKCNLRCLHCYGPYGEQEEGELSGEQWRKIFNDLSMAGTFFVNISGGEPTVHPDFPDIMRFLKKAQLPFILTTNGLFGDRTREVIYKVRKIILGMKFSLDGPTPESHAALRLGMDGKTHLSFFHRTLENIRFFSARGVPITIATVLHSKNERLVLQMAKLIDEVRPVSWFVSTIAPMGRALDNPEIFASDTALRTEAWRGIQRKLMDRNIYVRYIDMPHAEAYSSEKSLYSCPAATWSCEISPSGLVAPCTMARIEIPRKILEFDNIVGSTIKDVWNGAAFEKFRYWKTVGCEGCTLLEHCGRCVPQSIKWFGDPMRPPAFCVAKGELLDLKNLQKLRSILRRRKEDLGSGQTYFG